MNSFKDVAFQILKENGKPLHSREITKIALRKGLLKTRGKTPWATMNAVLVTDFNSKKTKSMFVKTGPSSFAMNNKFVAEKVVSKPVRVPLDEEFVKHAIIKYIS